MFLKATDGVGQPVDSSNRIDAAGRPSRFTHVRFGPTIDGQNYRWQWRKQPVPAGDVCNPAVWRGQADGKPCTLWRQFGGGTFHGVATSDDGIRRRRVAPQVMSCHSDKNLPFDPFGVDLPWWSSSGRDGFGLGENCRCHPWHQPHSRGDRRGQTRAAKHERPNTSGQTRAIVARQLGRTPVPVSSR